MCKGLITLSHKSYKPWNFKTGANVHESVQKGSTPRRNSVKSD